MKVQTTATKSQPAYRVHVVEPQVPVIDGWTRCEVGEDLIVDSDSIHSYCLAAWDSRVYDAFVLAAAVQFCDLTNRRHAPIWGRNIQLRVPVHDPDRWNSPDISKTLHAALGLLTGDQWQVIFTPRKDYFPSPAQAGFCIPDSTGIVMPFSDGLDSLAVAKLMERKLGSSLIRVRLGSNALSNRNGNRTEQPFANVPFRVKTGRTVEFSARSRGFKFMLLCGIAAHLLGAQEIVVPESGQGALGPVLVPVGQAYEDYRCHPVFTDRMTALVGALFGHSVRYRYPRLWCTKGQTLREAMGPQDNEVDPSASRSCWQSARHVSVLGKRR